MSHDVCLCLHCFFIIYSPWFSVAVCSRVLLVRCPAPDHLCLVLPEY